MAGWRQLAAWLPGWPRLAAAAAPDEGGVDVCQGAGQTLPLQAGQQGARGRQVGTGQQGASGEADGCRTACQGVLEEGGIETLPK